MASSFIIVAIFMFNNRIPQKEVCAQIVRLTKIPEHISYDINGTPISVATQYETVVTWKEGERVHYKVELIDSVRFNRLYQALEDHKSDTIYIKF